VRVSEEKKVTNAQLKQEKTQRFALLGGIVLVGLFGVFMFNRFKITKKQNHLIQLQKTELQKQKELVEEHQKETLDSIHYAKRIQTALIANSDFISQHIPNNFIYFNPKDIVSGDFYWATKHNDKFYLAVCDSTGHGVPGAFMSLLNMGFLSEAIKEKNIEKPNEIFNYVRARLISTISDGGQKDGMDGILICVDTSLSVRAESRIITYAAANNEPILIRDNEIIELPKDKMPVGKGEKTEMFSLQSVELQSGDALYLYTDGFADQFGGPKGKKFKYKQLNELLLSIKDSSLPDQKDKLESAFTNWQGNQEQVDDVLIIGIKI
jgi:serine phosphatase RsbU (regulator of sigma subunit)